jgi:hypothetical protein
MGKREERTGGKAESTSSTGWPCVDFLYYRLQLYLHQTSSQSVNQLWSMFKAAKKNSITQQPKTLVDSSEILISTLSMLRCKKNESIYFFKRGLVLWLIKAHTYANYVMNVHRIFLSETLPSNQLINMLTPYLDV